MLILLALAVLIIFSVHIYKAARNTGRSAVLWVLLNIVVGIALQIVIPIVTYLIVLSFVTESGRDSESLFMLSTIIGVSGIFLSFGAMYLVLRFASIAPDSGPINQPPPPPEFGDNIQ